MARLHGYLLLCMLAAITAATTAVWSARAPSAGITIATWNMEWLVSAPTAHAARLACRNGRHAALPCDVAQQLARDSADLARLASYASELDADIIAFQEVENAAIARQIFRGYLICIAEGPGLQHVGFAVRNGVAHECGPMLKSLGMNGRSRNAMSLRFTRGGGQTVELLVVHLKSGCSRNPLDAGPAACRMLEQQAHYLGDWIAAQAAVNAAFIVLGDFNRIDSLPEQDVFWQLLHPHAFELLATQLPFRNCFVGQPYSRFIDHMLVSRPLQQHIIPGSARRMKFRSADAVRYRLSDHCAISISLNRVAPQK